MPCMRNVQHIMLKCKSIIDVRLCLLAKQSEQKENPHLLGIIGSSGLALIDYRNYQVAQSNYDKTNIIISCLNWRRSMLIHLSVVLLVVFFFLDIF